MINISEDGNTVEIKLVLKAIPQTKCDGCIFSRAPLEKYCIDGQIQCKKWTRPDQRNVIFVEANDEN